jgi:integrase/recombinase XerD
LGIGEQRSSYGTRSIIVHLLSEPRDVFYALFKGKGRKERSVPLWHSTAKALQAWFRELDDSSSAVAFPNARGSSLTRDGVNYILQQAVERAFVSCPSLKNKRIFPHIFRYSCTLHLLQSGVDIAVIALWLGHQSIQTTHGYIEADLAIKEQAFQKLALPAKPSPDSRRPILY